LLDPSPFGLIVDDDPSVAFIADAELRDSLILMGAISSQD
jgi:hypothetical protein